MKKSKKTISQSDRHLNKSKKPKSRQFSKRQWLEKLRKPETLRLLIKLGGQIYSGYKLLKWLVEKFLEFFP